MAGARSCRRCAAPARHVSAHQKRRETDAASRSPPTRSTSPPGWFDEDEFDATARNFTNPDWVAITLNAYRSRFLADEPRDPRCEPSARRLAEVEQIATPTLMIQGADDRCDEPSASANQERFFTGGYQRVLLDGVGHFPHREASDEIATIIAGHLQATAAD